MRRAIYGYMRVATDHGDLEETARIRKELSEYAERGGFILQDLFAERGQCSESAFITMVEKLKRSKVNNVIVPSLWHFARLPGLQEVMKSYVEQEIDAHIWVVQGQHR